MHILDFICFAKCSLNFLNQKIYVFKQIWIVSAIISSNTFYSPLSHSISQIFDVLILIYNTPRLWSFITNVFPCSSDCMISIDLESSLLIYFFLNSQNMLLDSYKNNSSVPANSFSKTQQFNSAIQRWPKSASKVHCSW